MVAIRHGHVAHHHQYTCYALCRAIPSLVFQWLFRRYGELEAYGRIGLIEQFYLVVVYLTPFQLDSLATLVFGADHDAPRLLVVGNHDAGVGLDVYLALIAVFMLGQLLLLLVFSLLFLVLVLVLLVVGPYSVHGRCSLAYHAATYRAVARLVETLVGFFQEGNVVVQLLQIECTVDAERSVHVDGVAQ